MVELTTISLLSKCMLINDDGWRVARYPHRMGEASLSLTH